MRPLALLVFLTACSLGGSRPSYQYYVLTSTPPLQVQVASNHERTLGITQITIPRYLDREQIAVRSGSQVVYSTTDRWAEPLDEAFARTLRENLAARLASSAIAIQDHEGESTYGLDVDVLRFERSGAHDVELWARWTLRSDAEIIDHGETRLRVPLSTSSNDAAALALSDAIARMATDIAAHVRKADVIAARSTPQP